MIQFPETAQAEWSGAVAQIDKRIDLRKRVERGVQVERQVERLHVAHEAKILFQQQLDAELTPPLVIGTLSDYLANPVAAQNDLIEGVMRDDGVCTVLGPSGAGKTTIALQMAHSLVTGQDWLGQPVQQINGSVGLLSYDQSANISVNWMERAGIPHDRASVVDINGRGNPLSVPEQRRQIIAAWRQMKVEIVIVDSFSASFTGMDQNDAGATMHYYNEMKRFALSDVGAKALVLIVHSTDSNPLKPRGSTVHKDAVDTMVGVTLEDGPARQRKIQMVKYRETGTQAMSPVLVTPPDSVTHLVDLDLQAMGLAGIPIAPHVAAARAFAPLPASHTAPQAQDEDSDEIDQEDDL